jgi:transcriptional regulator with XRE-family HTH domain
MGFSPGRPSLQRTPLARVLYERGITQRELIEATGLGKNTIELLARGGRHKWGDYPWTARSLALCSAALGVEPCELAPELFTECEATG